MMEQYQISALLNNDMGEILKAMDSKNMPLAVELLEDLVLQLLVDREDAVISELESVRGRPQDVNDKIAAAKSRKENRKASIHHPKGNGNG